MKCPRCNSKVPDNLKYCGFCGIEIKTGREKSVEYWMEYIRTILHLNQDNRGIASRYIIASATLGIVSILTLVVQIPFETVQSIVIGVLALIGMGVSGYLLYVLVISVYENQVLLWMYEEIYYGILVGELNTSSDVMTYRHNLMETLKEDLKHTLETREDYEKLKETSK
ncbi:MAG: zinc ribbon domain-containing protein [Methanomassiliicoccales archaeon]|nr:MAG: zinc ribbon domain-containing protein [Methanomassiliicoccales archaeon]